MREAIREMRGSYAKTFPSHFPMLRMDRIYYRGIELEHAECHRRSPWNELSDHLPVQARFDIGAPGGFESSTELP